MEVALRPDVPADRLRVSEQGLVYCSGVATDDAYRPLCRSHHSREGALRAAASRSAVVDAAVKAEMLRVDHAPGHSDECRICPALDRLDEAARNLMAAL